LELSHQLLDWISGLNNGYRIS